MSERFAAGHERWADSPAAWVLGALPADEAQAFAAHLAVCPACQAEVEELEPAVAVLPLAADPLPAPRALGERVMAEVRREAQLLERRDAPAAARPERPRRAWLRWPVPALAAAALIVGLVVGLAVGGGDGSRTYPVATAGAARAAHATLIVDDDHTMLEAHDLPAPPAGRVYQVWLKPHGGAPEPTDALFVPRSDGSAMVAVPGRVSAMEAVLVSVEPRGGSEAPTTPPVLTAEMS